MDTSSSDYGKKLKAMRAAEGLTQQQLSDPVSYTHLTLPTTDLV